MKLTNRNLDLVFNVIKNNMEDENGRGEFDEDCCIEFAVERVIDWIKHDKKIKYDK